MKITLLAAVAALGLGVAPAFAADMQSNGGYTHPDFWGTETVQQAPAAKAPAQSNGTAIGASIFAKLSESLTIVLMSRTGRRSCDDTNRQWNAGMAR